MSAIRAASETSGGHVGHAQAQQGRSISGFVSTETSWSQNVAWALSLLSSAMRADAAARLAGFWPMASVKPPAAPRPTAASRIEAGLPRSLFTPWVHLGAGSSKQLGD
eukprot:4908230-Pyramimonas_sp.AAC.1